jgi:hypothetical protein
VIAIEPAPEKTSNACGRNFSKEIGEGRVVIYPKGVWIKMMCWTLNVDPQTRLPIRS